MLVFADFDNVDGLIKSRGVGHIIERIVNSVSRLPIAAQPRIDVRFYGGWFYEDRLSKRGQEISSELSGNFPKVHTVIWEGESEPVNVRVNGHIARGISACESVHLYHTFRRRPFSGQLYFKHSVRERCRAPDCPLDVIEAFILSRRCPADGCAVEQHDVLDRCEQKLVDTMLVSDLIYWASRPNHPLLAVLSSDDDMWPGIRTAVSFAQPIIQIHTMQSPLHMSYVNRLSTNSYMQTRL